MAWQAIFQNGLTYAAWAVDVLNGLLGDIINQDKLSYMKENSDLQSKMHFTETKALNPYEVFTEQVGAYELDEITEGQSLPIIDVEKGADKGFQLKIFGTKLSITKYFMEWLKTNQNIKGADSSIKTYYNQLANATINLTRAAMKSKYDDMAQVFAKGWVATSAYGAGSPTPYGKALFATDHPIMNGTSSFSNVLNAAGQTADKVLSATSLQWALDNQKTALRLQNGDFVGNTSGVYELRVPRALEQQARVILNQAGGQKNSFAGTGSNAQLLNPFDFNGNVIELKVIEPLGRTLKDGTVLGSNTMWFVVNPELVNAGTSLRHITLWGENVETHYDFDTKNYFASIDLSFTNDHYGAQYWVVGSRGTVA